MRCTGGWVGPRAGLDGRKSRFAGIRSPDRPARSQSLYQLSYLAHTSDVCVDKYFHYQNRQNLHVSRSSQYYFSPKRRHAFTSYMYLPENIISNNFSGDKL